MRVTKDQSLILKEFSKSMTVPQIHLMTGLPHSTIRYHISDKIRADTIRKQQERYSKLTKEEKKEIYKRNYKYGKEYFKRRYHEDEEFRKKVIQANIKCKRKRALKGGKKK